MNVLEHSSARFTEQSTDSIVDPRSGLIASGVVSHLDTSPPSVCFAIGS